MVIPRDEFQAKVAEMEALGYRLASFVSPNDGAPRGTYVLEFAKTTRFVPLRLATQEPIHLGDFIFDLNTFTLARNGIPVDITTTEFKILSLLAKNLEKVVSTKEIMVFLDRGNAYMTPQEAGENIKVYIGRIRRKVEGLQIINVRGIGYRIVPPSSS